MATRQELKAVIRALLDHALGIRHFQSLRPISGKLYEAYVFGLCLQALKELGADLRMNTANGSRGGFIFRGGPGQIYSQTNGYAHVEVALNGEEFELHAGIEYRGSSGMLHEIDVSILSSREAERCREANVNPRPSSLVGAWECKFYGGNLQKEVGRTFVGLLADMGSSYRVSGICSNSENSQLRLYCSKKTRPYAHFLLAPRMQDAEEHFVAHVKTEFRKLAPPR